MVPVMLRAVARHQVRISPVLHLLLLAPAVLLLALLEMVPLAIVLGVAGAAVFLVPGVKFRRTDRMILGFGILGALVLLFILLPVVHLLWVTGGEEIGTVAGERTVQQALWLTPSAALWATLVSVGAGVPLAYVLARERFLGKAIVEGIIDIPVVIPHTVAGIALLFILGPRSGLLGAPLAERFDILLIDTWGGIVVAMLFVSIPFLTNQARDGFAKVDPRLEHVARTLGSSRFGAFARVTVPLSWRSILSGSILTWARAISEFGSIAVIAYYPLSATTLIYERYQAFGLAGAKPVAALMTLLALGIFISLRAAANLPSRHQGANG